MDKEDRLGFDYRSDVADEEESQALVYDDVPYRTMDLTETTFVPTQRWSDNAAYRSLGQGHTVHSILVLKLDHVGDFVLALDALLCLRRGFPDATLDLACGPWNVSLARSTGLFNEIFEVSFFDARADGKQPVFNPHMLNKLTGKAWDLVIDLRVDTDTRVLLRHIAARWKFGFESAVDDDALTLALPSGRRESDLGSIGMNQTMLMLRLVHTVIDILLQPNDSAELLVKRVAVPSPIDLSFAVGRHLVVCNTSSGRVAKNWPLDRFKRLISWMANDLDCGIVLVGDASQASDAVAITQFAGSANVVSAVGSTTLPEAVGIIAQSSFYIGNDTGLTHIAAKIGVPTVALFSAIDPTPSFAPLGTNTIILLSKVPCSSCHILHLRDCTGGHACVLNISESTVRTAVINRLLVSPRYTGKPVTSPRPSEPPMILPPEARSAVTPEEQFLGHEIPQRYNDNLHRYLAGGGRLDLKDLARAFISGNDNNRGDMNRLYALALVFDQLTKEQIPGDLAELGVYKGNTAYLLADFARKSGVTAYLLDTFEGFKADDLQGIDADKRHEFSDTSLDGVKALVGTAGVQYVQGYFPETAAQIPQDARFCLVHIDCDLYAPFKAALDYFYPRLEPGGFMIMHDYSSLHWNGAERAVDEFFCDKPESVISIPDGSGTVMIRRQKPTGGSTNWHVSTQSSGFANAWVDATSHPIESFLTDGWAAPEEWGTWGLGDRHTLTLLFLEPSDEVELAVESQMALVRGRESCFTDVVVGDKRLARWDYTGELNRGVRFVCIPRDLMTPREHGLFALDVVFQPGSCKPPQELDPTIADARSLGFGLVRFRQRQSAPAAAGELTKSE